MEDVPIELDATDAAPRDPAGLDRTMTVAGRARPAPDGSADGAHVAADDAASALGPGTRLAHFRIERRLGVGGMGQVWLATDLALDRPVAIKMLLAGVGGDPDRRRRLIREARAQARLVHPHVCHIYFIGEEDGRVFFAMEYVDGETLAQRLERGPLPPDQALELARQAALGLRAADEAGFTHRDIKPSNLMIDRHGVLKVMDFGLVSAAAAELEAAGAGVDHGPVAASAMVGTPLYMAPEQGRGEIVDRRADIYALGATLHHMIAGAPPFVGDTAAELLTRHQTSDRPRLTIAGTARRRAGLAESVVGRMMAKRPADRYPHYDELIAALDQASTRRTRPAGIAVRLAAAFLDLMTVGLITLPMTALLDAIDENVWILAVALLAYPAAIARWGATPGRALLDLEVIPQRGTGRVRFAQAALRFLACFGPIALGVAVSAVGDAAGVPLVDSAGELMMAAGAVYLLVEAVRMAVRSVDKRTAWDLIAGTRVCYRRSREDRA